MPSTYDPLDFRPPPLDLLAALTLPQRLYHRPVFTGLENLGDARPTLYVGNHTLFGVLDIPLLLERIYRETGRFPRGLADHLHYAVPGWRDFLHRFGGVEGTRENCGALMEAGETVLVFPGGGREVAKRKGEAYELLWKERLGFVRMALRHGYSITPFASVGAEECYTILLDADDMTSQPAWKWVEESPLGPALRGGELVVPLATGFLGTPVPRPERFYFGFGAPIETAGSSGRDDDESLLHQLRDATRDSIRSMIATLRERQAADRAEAREARARVAELALDVIGWLGR